MENIRKTTVLDLSLFQKEMFGSKRKKVYGRYRYRWKAGSNKKKLPIQFIKNIQHSYSNRDTGRKPGREFDGIICFLERGKGEELVLCARLGQEFCPLHLQ